MRVLTALVLITAGAPAPTAPTAGGGVPEGWTLIDPAEAYSSRIDTVEKHCGRASALLECTTSHVDDFGVLMQAFRADAYRGRRVRLPGYMRTRRVAGSARLWLQVDGADTSLVAFDNMAERPCPRRHRVVVVRDRVGRAGAVQVAFGAVLAGKGRLWVDDLKVEVVGNDVPPTDTHVPAVPTDMVASPEPPSQPVYAGFEEELTKRWLTSELHSLTPVFAGHEDEAAYGKE